MRENLSRLSRWKDWLLIFAFIGVYMVPRLFNLGTYATADEPLYLKKAASFYYLVRDGRFNETDLIIHPGIVNLWAGAAGFFVNFPEYASHPEAKYPIADLHFREIFVNSGRTQLELLATGRALTILIQTLILGAALFFFQRIIGVWPAFLGFMLLSFDPFNFANSRILQPDGIMSASLLLSVIAFMDYLKNNWRTSLFASGIGAGLCWLSKLVGMVLGPMVLGITAIFWWQYHRLDWRKARLMIRDLVIWFAVALIVFFALWPMMWVEPLETLVSYVEKSFFMSQDVNSPMFFNGELHLKGEFGLNYFYYYLIVLFNQTTPLVLLGLVLGAVAIFWKRRKNDIDLKTNFALTGLFIAMLIFLVFMTLSNKKADRYVLTAFMHLDLLAGAGFWLLVQRLKRTFPNISQFPAVVLAVIFVGLQASLVWQVAPYYHSYYNPLWGSAERYFERFPVGWGEGLDQAARYLNSKENMKNKVVYAWYASTFDLFYDNRSKQFSITPSILDARFNEFVSSDYLVIYISQWQRQANTMLIQFLADKPPEYTVEINGFEYVKVYNLADVREQTGE